MTNRLISLTVGTQEAEEWFRTFQEISELAANLGASHHYVSVSSIDPEEQSEEDYEDLYYDEKTLEKVGRVLLNHGIDLERIPSVLSEMKNAGILFRERR
jgi:hypothetical protein